MVALEYGLQYVNRQGLYADCYPVETGIIIAIIIHRGSELGSGKIRFYAKVTI